MEWRQTGKNEGLEIEIDYENDKKGRHCDGPFYQIQTVLLKRFIFSSSGIPWRKG
jgi:hypothetical protein